MIKTFIKTGDIKAEFGFCNNLYSIAHSKVSEGSFEVEFREIKQSKTYLQLKGIHKLCEIYGVYMTETLGHKVNFENAKESLKYAINYTRLANEDEAFADEANDDEADEADDAEQPKLNLKQPETPTDNNPLLVSKTKQKIQWPLRLTHKPEQTSGFEFL